MVDRCWVRDGAVQPGRDPFKGSCPLLWGREEGVDTRKEVNALLRSPVEGLWEKEQHLREKAGPFPGPSIAAVPTTLERPMVPVLFRGSAALVPRLWV